MKTGLVLLLLLVLPACGKIDTSVLNLAEALNKRNLSSCIDGQIIHGGIMSSTHAMMRLRMTTGSATYEQCFGRGE